MKKTLAILVLTAAAAAPAAANNFAQRRRNQAWASMRRSPTGAALYAKAAGKAGVWFYWEAEDRVLDKTWFLEDAGQIRVHADSLSAWPEYIGFLFVQGYTAWAAHDVARGLAPSETMGLLEVDQWAWLGAMRHWDEIGAGADKDYANDEQWGAQWQGRFDASPSALLHLYRTDLEGFLAWVSARRKRLGYATNDLPAFIRAHRGGKKDAALRLQAAWQAFLQDEIARRVGGVKVQGGSF